MTTIKICEDLASHDTPRPLFIDPHCHTFNASDLPMNGFSRYVMLDTDESLLKKAIFDVLLRLVTTVLENKAPGYHDEMDKIGELMAGDEVELEDGASRYAERLLAEVSRLEKDGNEDERELTREMYGELEMALDKMAESKDPNLQRLVDEAADSLERAANASPLDDDVDASDADAVAEELAYELKALWASSDPSDNLLAEEVREELEMTLQELAADWGLIKKIKNKIKKVFKKLVKSVKKFLKFIKKSISRFLRLVTMATQWIVFGFGGTILRYLEWVRLLVRYRFEIADELMQIYGTDRGCVDLFTPSLVDFSAWLGPDPPETSLVEQVELMSKNIELHNGSLLAFLGYDPLRDEKTKGKALELVKKAIEERGFVGVKVYPPMGFAAFGNADLTFEQVEYLPHDIGAKLDARLEALYEYCRREDVPIMAHCNDTNYTKKGYAERAAPENWKKALDLPGMAGLRVNLGHFGKGDAAWQEQIVAMMAAKTGDAFTYPNLFTDVGHYQPTTATADSLEKAMKAHPGVRTRLMYASDWIMLAKEKGANDYFERHVKAFLSRFGWYRTLLFVGWNAARFVGLRKGEATRARLDRFFADKSKPTWMDQVDNFNLWWEDVGDAMEPDTP